MKSFLTAKLRSPSLYRLRLPLGGGDRYVRAMSKTDTNPGFDLAALWTAQGRAIVGGAIAVAVVVGGGWFWMASRDLKESRAEDAYASAERTFYSGNAPLATSELTRVVTRYGDTRAGVRATMLLAQAHYIAGEHAEGVEQLRAVVGSGAARPYRAPLHALIAAGLESQSQFDDAAAAYAQAASAATTQFDRDLYEADQARALASAGKSEAALAIWRRHADREAAPTASEARLRIGELAARASN